MAKKRRQNPCRKRRWLTASELVEMWVRWQRGQTTKEIGRVLAALLFGLLLPISFGASTVRATVQDEGVLRVETRLVQVDIVVRDDGTPVTDLTMEDFRIFDDGLEQEIAVFDVVRADIGVEVTPLADGVVSNRLDWRGALPNSATAILVDRINTPLTDQLYVDYQVREFLRTADDGDRLALYELSDGLRMIQDYTGDPDVLMRAAATMRIGERLEVPDETGLTDKGLDPQLAEFAANGGFDPNAELDRLRGQIYFETRANQTADALQAIARHMADLPGRKSLVWLATHFPITYNPQRHSDFFPDQGLSYRDLENIHQAVVMLIEANVAVYPVHAPGLTAFHPRELDLMMTLAEMTGGQARYNTNGLEAAIREAVQDTRVSYRLGFYPIDASDAEFHNLEVRVDRPGLEVRHRSGYFGFVTAQDQNQVSLAELLTSPFAPSSLGLAATASVVDADSGVYLVALSVDLKDLTLELHEEFREGLLTVGMLYHEEEGEIRILPQDPIPIRMREDGFQERLETFVVVRNVETEGRPGRLRIAVQEPSTGAAGALWLPLETRHSPSLPR